MRRDTRLSDEDGSPMRRDTRLSDEDDSPMRRDTRLSDEDGSLLGVSSYLVDETLARFEEDQVDGVGTAVFVARPFRESDGQEKDGASEADLPTAPQQPPPHQLLHGSPHQAACAQEDAAQAAHHPAAKVSLGVAPASTAAFTSAIMPPAAAMPSLPATNFVVAPNTPLATATGAPAAVAASILATSSHEHPGYASATTCSSGACGTATGASRENARQLLSQILLGRSPAAAPHSGQGYVHPTPPLTTTSATQQGHDSERGKAWQPPPSPLSPGWGIVPTPPSIRAGADLGSGVVRQLTQGAPEMEQGAQEFEKREEAMPPALSDRKPTASDLIGLEQQALERQERERRALEHLKSTLAPPGSPSLPSTSPAALSPLLACSALKHSPHSLSPPLPPPLHGASIQPSRGGGDAGASATCAAGVAGPCRAGATSHVTRAAGHTSRLHHSRSPPPRPTSPLQRSTTPHQRPTSPRQPPHTCHGIPLSQRPRAAAIPEDDISRDGALPPGSAPHDRSIGRELETSDRTKRARTLLLLFLHKRAEERAGRSPSRERRVPRHDG